MLKLCGQHLVPSHSLLYTEVNIWYPVTHSYILRSTFGTQSLTLIYWGLTIFHWFYKRKRKRKHVCLQPEIPIEFSRLYNLIPWYWNSLLYGLISSGENSALVYFAAAIANHYSLASSFHQVPIIAGWTESVIWQTCQYLYTWPSAWPCTTAVWELKPDYLAPLSLQ